MGVELNRHVEIIRPYCFPIRGHIYQFLSPPYQNEANKPEYGQLYIFDSAEART
jgi:hypothetical protein